MKISGLAHVVLQVRNRERSEAFYHGLLGLPIAARYEPVRSTFFSIGNDHHCFAIIEVGDDASLPDPRGAGLRHVAFRLADSPAELVSVKRRIEAAGATIQKILDHGITLSIYVKDPDDNVVELYIDVSDEWKGDASAVVLTPRPLRLE